MLRNLGAPDVTCFLLRDGRGTLATSQELSIEHLSRYLTGFSYRSRCACCVGPSTARERVGRSQTYVQASLEIEFAPKGKERLSRIVEGYATASDYSDAVFFVKHAAVGRLLIDLIEAAGATASLADILNIQSTPIVVEPWPGLCADDAAKLQRVLSS